MLKYKLLNASLGILKCKHSSKKQSGGHFIIFDRQKTSIAFLKRKGASLWQFINCFLVILINFNFKHFTNEKERNKFKIEHKFSLSLKEAISL